MILSNVEMHRALDEGRLIIEPQPTPRTPSLGQDCPFGTHSVDLRLGDEISVPKSGPFVYDLTKPGNLADLIRRNSDTRRLQVDQPFHLEPRTFVLGRTFEKVGLPIDTKMNRDRNTCLAARIEGKSSRARVGLLVHFTAPTVHPGFEGTLTPEMINLGPATIALIPKMPIAQLIIEQVVGRPIENPSVFQNQTTPEGLPASVKREQKP